ncbi:MAG: S41 family peptidase [Proteobacteria bacterium]|nr:S41 family peptidase [Pseudomonadota bacterium]MDE3208008.1 S41 family peptidase [Pseudomonadota bacterium]
MRVKFQRLGLIAFGVIIGVMLTLNFPAIADKVQPIHLPIDELHTFAKVFGKIKSDYVEPVSDKKLINAAITGMVSGLDPHSAFLNRQEYRALQVDTHGEFGGLGIEVTMDEGLLKVISPIEDSPAYKAGIKSGDLIIKLNDTPVKGLTLEDAVKLMRGKPNTKIILTLLRKGANKPLVIPVTRAIIKVKSVKYKLVKPGFGWIHITEFQERTPESMVHAINALYKQNKGPLKGIVLDLRNDPGGLLNSAVGVVSAFVKPGALVVYTKGRTPDSNMHLTASPQYYLDQSNENDYIKDLPASVKQVPLVVLINGGSASASEIVAGALQDQNRATIMGTQSFGKGSVQTVIPLGNGTALKLTTARYYTPSGRSIQDRGITPNIVVHDPNGEDGNLLVKEVDLPHHLHNDTPEPLGATLSPAPSKPVNKTSFPHKKGKKIKPTIFGSANDYQLKEAIKVMQGIHIAGEK